MNDNNQTFNHRVKQDENTAIAYGSRKRDKHLAEMKLIERGIAYLDSTVDSMLDAPCGVGRATILLAEHGYQTTGLDLGRGAVEMTQREVTTAGVTASIVQGDLLAMEFADEQFDGLLCFRLYHHLPDEDLREKLIGELCRVTKKYVLISYFSPYSVTSIKRELRRKLGLKISKQHATTLESIESQFQKQGFRLITDLPQQRFIHTLHLAIFERIQG